MQEDPVGYLLGPNLYTYVGNNPVNRIDPFGLWEWKDIGKEAEKYLNEVGKVMEQDYPNTLDMKSLFGGVSNVAGATGTALGSIPKSIGYGHGDFIMGGRTAYRWTNQWGQGVKYTSFAQAGFSGSLLSIASSAMTGYALGATIRSYVVGFSNYMESKKDK